MTPEGHLSARPECIRVAVIDRDKRFPHLVSESLERGLGAHVTHVDRLVLNGAKPPHHVVIVNDSSDPGLSTLKLLREKWSEKELPVIVVGDDDQGEVDAMVSGASYFVDRSLHPGTDFLEKLVYGLAYER